MNTVNKLPNYSVEFLPLERRLLERRSHRGHLGILARERRKIERRLPSAKAIFSS